MRYAKFVKDGYIEALGTGDGGAEITAEEYAEIMSVIQSKPPRTETTDYRLKEDLTWEEYKLPAPVDPDPDAEEILGILLGGAE